MLSESFESRKYCSVEDINNTRFMVGTYLMGVWKATTNQVLRAKWD